MGEERWSPLLLKILAEEQTQQFKRMVFNVLVGNVDDHTKNFSFVMWPNGEWHISPAYDMLFSIDPDSLLNRQHELSVQGKRKNITKQDLLRFASMQDVKAPESIIDHIAEVVSRFRTYAEAVGISDFWINKIG